MKNLTQLMGSRSRQTLLAVMIASTAALSFQLRAAPGAHGPGGEHLDAPGAAVSTSNASPRLESKSETFELVARLEGGVLSILIDRYETNEPVLGANVDIESGATKAKATFRAEQGDYAVTDPAMLKLLAGPGTHSLIFTIGAGKDSDLLDGKLVPGSANGPHGSDAAQSHGRRGIPTAAWSVAALLGVGMAIFFFRRWRTARPFPFKRAGGTR